MAHRSDDQDAVRESIANRGSVRAFTVGSAATGERVDLVARAAGSGVDGYPDARLRRYRGGACIRDLPYPAPVVFLTAPTTQIAQDAAESGSFGYLVKLPYARQRLRDADRHRAFASGRKHAASPTSAVTIGAGCVCRPAARGGPERCAERVAGNGGRAAAGQWRAVCLLPMGGRTHRQVSGRRPPDSAACG